MDCTWRPILSPLYCTSRSPLSFFRGCALALTRRKMLGGALGRWIAVRRDDPGKPSNAFRDRVEFQSCETQNEFEFGLRIRIEIREAGG